MDLLKSMNNYCIGVDLAAGRVVEVLPEYSALERPVFALYPHRLLPPRQACSANSSLSVFVSRS